MHRVIREIRSVLPRIHGIKIPFKNVLKTAVSRVSRCINDISTDIFFTINRDRYTLNTWRMNMKNSLFNIITFMTFSTH